ncbi:hypothetical protein AAMO2058_000731700, partial [Amorphochlora amoebiformis]
WHNDFRLPAGTLVRVYGLVRLRRNEGKLGKIEGYEDRRGCYIVKMISNEDRIYVPPSGIRHMLKSVQIREDGQVKRCRVTGYNSSDGKYKVIIKGTRGRERHCLWSDLILSPGEYVTITGLTKQTEYNGATGKVKRWSQEEGRYVIALRRGYTKAIIRLKPANLQA